MLHKAGRIGLGVLCLLPVYSLIMVMRAEAKGKSINATWEDFAAVGLLATCGLAVFASVIFED